MKSIKQLLYPLPVRNLTGNADFCPTGITLDSRQVKPGMLFAALPGTQTDGHRFIPDAIRLGAGAILCEILPEKPEPNVTYAVVTDAPRTLSHVAASYFGYPAEKLKLVGITGTNGKTTIATLLYRLFELLGYRSGLLSTIRVRIHNRVLPATHTTPDAIVVNRILAEMVQAGCDYAFMEVSSHALEQERVSGLKYSGAVFTNLTRDHLDYHPDVASYLKAKKKLFDQLSPDAFALVNADDKNGAVMLQNCRALKKTYGLRSVADYHGQMIETGWQGTLLQIETQEVWTRFAGRFNGSNLLAVYAVARLLGQEKEQILTTLSQLTPVEGRMEQVDLGRQITGIVDYAHTPDALENVLKTLTDLRKPGKQVITVFGAGGDRDKGKRPEMAKVACRYSDRVIITSDNPRTENPEQIIRDIEMGIPAAKRPIALSVTRRDEAIRTAFALAQPGDVILVAGKGHETYQEINGVRHHFDDREELEKLTKQTQ